MSADAVVATHSSSPPRTPIVPTAPYGDRLKAHLATYKRRRLGVTRNGKWRANDKEYEHILPEDLHQLNILEAFRAEFWDYFEANSRLLALHTDFHHLNSSQAFAFNLLFPFIGSAAESELLATALGSAGRPIVSSAFEHMPDLAERTTVDLHATLSDGARLVIEVKLTEKNFGQCIPGDEHRRKYREHYLPRLVKLARPESLAADNFFLNHQLFRNLSHLDVSRGDVLVLLVPRANAVAWADGRRFMEACLQDEARACVRLIAVEDVVRHLRESLPREAARLHSHLDLLAEKYLPA
jgi:hypothetical protein